MRKFQGFTALLACVAVVAASLVVASTTAEAQPPQPTAAVPPIIGNAADGILRNVPTQYYAAIDDFENTAIQEVLDTHNLPPSDAQAVKAWGRDAVRTQEYLDLLRIITKPAANRSNNEALVYEWFQGLYKDQQVAQAQAAVDQYLKWSGLTTDTITDDPIPEVLTGTGAVSTDSGFCNFRPPKPLDNKNGMFDGTYNPRDLPECNGHAGTEAEDCAGLATGCPVPWPTVEQFQQWGRYVSQQNLFESVVFVNQALEISTGVGLAATMAATGVGTALSRAYLAVPTSGSGLFAKVFPYSARAWSVGADIVEEAAVSSARVAAGLIRAGAAAMVVGTVITAIVTIVLESLTIAEHRKIPVTLLDGLAQAKAAVPDLGAILNTDGGPGALLTTFLSTTQIDVDPDCVLPSPDRFYSSFPCANAPTPAAATSTDDRFYVTNDASGNAAGEVRSSIYAVDPIDSTVAASANESVRLSGNGWFVTTKYDGSKVENQAAPVTPGATMQNLRLSYRDWDGKTVDAERIQDANGHPTFALTILDKDYVGPCSTPPTGGAISPCLTDTIRYVQPDGTKASARVLTASDAEPDIAAAVPSRAVAGVPITLSATATASFGFDGPFFYRWTVPGEGTLEGASVPATFNLAGTISVQLEVIDNNGVTVATRSYPVLVAQTTQIGIGFYPPSPAAYGSAPLVWAGVAPDTAQGVQCTWNQTTGVIGCVNPTGVVQFFIDGNPAGDPVPVTNTSQPCPHPNNCLIFIGNNVEYTPAIALPGLTGAAGTHHTVTATYYGDDKFVGSTGTTPFDIVAATPDVALTSGTTYPSPTQPVTLTATVRPKPGSTGVPTGTVTFLPNGSNTPLAPAVPVGSDGTATLNVATLKFVTGLVVRYSGDANFAPTDSTSYPISFSPQPSTANVQPVSSTAPVGSNVDLKVTILDDAGNPVPGASVSISPGGATGQTGSDGTATLTVSSTVPGPVTYTVSANGVANLGSATVTYVNTNSAPTASPTSATTDEDTPATVTPLGSDVDGDALSYAVTSQPANGSAAVTPQGLVYTPNANFNGTDSFTYTASDGSLTSPPATVTMTVNPVDDPPVGQDTIVTTAEDTPVSILPTATDPDSPVTFQLLSGPAHGTVTGGFAPWVYTPAANYAGTDSFTYAIGGGGYIVGKTVYITVTPVNDAPTAADTSATTNEDTATVITPPTNDVDGDQLTVAVASGPTHGAVVQNGANSFRYTPAANYSGTDSFTYRASDGTATSPERTVTITVNAVNDAPTVSPIGDATVVYSDAITPITVTASDVESGTNLTWSQAGLPAGLILAGSGGSATISGTVTAVPGPYSVTVKACDPSNACGTLSFTVTVAPETATVRLTQSNPNAVATVHGTAPAMTFTGRVTDAADGSFGDANRIQPANLSLQLVPVGGGNPVACPVTITRRVLATRTAPGFVDLSCSFPAGVKIDVYDVVLTASGSFAGSVDSVLAVYDPQARGATGVGVVDLGGGSRGEYAFAAASGSNGARGTVVYIEKDAQGNVVHRLFSLNLQALVIGSTLPITASITGKAVVDGVGNYGLIVTAVDGGASGDKFGLRVTGPAGAPSQPSLTCVPKPVIAPGVVTVH